MLNLKLKETLTGHVLRHPFLADILKSLLSNKIVANSPAYKKYVLKKSRQCHLSTSGRIPGVTIETTLDCNAKCIMCYHSKKKLNGIMDNGLFEKIIDDCSANGINEVGLSIYGEPLMDPLFFRRIEYLRRHDMKYRFFTNASMLTDNRARKLFELGGLKRINFSVSGYEKANYEKVMANLNREKTYSNILNFLELKKTFKQKGPVVAISFVKTKINHDDTEKFIRFWRRQQGVDQIITADLWNRVGSTGIRELGNIGKMHQKGRWLTPCRLLWGTMFIYYDGRVAPCCDDADLRQMIIGNMNDQNLREIYSGPQLENLRRLHMADKRLSHPVCGKCTHNSVWA